MDFIAYYFDVILHLNTHLAAIIAHFGVWTYAVLFLIIFCETGFFFTPFLPGESLLFAVGTLAATDALAVNWLWLLLVTAAILGGFVNYWIGNKLGVNLVMRPRFSVFKQYLQKTHEFYDKHGGKTIVIARLIPIIRTYAPFVAGMAKMNFRAFTLYNVLGGLAWISFFIYTSYFFGNIPIVKQNFSLVILVIIILSIVPVLIEFIRHFVKARKTL